MKEHIIIGAGISGLTAAQTLRKQGREVLLLEKSRGPGGRACTRRFDGKRFDHGAQYFTAKAGPFKALVEQLLEQGVVQSWFYTLHTPDGPFGESYPRYCVPGGMNGLGKHLAAGLDIELQRKVQTLRRDSGAWVLQCVDGEVFRARRVIFTCPAPQILDVIANSTLNDEGLNLAPLREVNYTKCITLLLSYNRVLGLGEPAAYTFSMTEPIAWLCDNYPKGVTDSASALTVQCGPHFSEAYFDKEDGEVIRALDEVVYEIINARPIATQIQRWRYAMVSNCGGPDYVELDQEKSLFACGEAFGGARIEGAFLSGLACGSALLPGR